MAIVAQSCAERLSESEQASLRKLCAGSASREIPNDDACTLLDLGLAELTCGDLGPTGAARSVFRCIQGH